METTHSTPSVRGAGRPRSEAARQAILGAAFRLTKNEGFSALTIEEIAREAGVGKPTIYRWWPSKSAIVFEALLQHAEQTIPEIPEGPLAANILALLQSLFRVLSTETGEILKGLMAEAQRDPAFATLFRTQFITKRREPLLILLRAGKARGELAADTNIEILADLIYGAMWYRLLTHHAPLDEKFAHDIVHTVLPGLLTSTDNMRHPEF